MKLLHKIEERNSPCCLGVQIRIVSTDGLHLGPWVESGKKPADADAWKAYKKMRRLETGKRTSKECQPVPEP